MSGIAFLNQTIRVSPSEFLVLIDVAMALRQLQIDQPHPLPKSSAVGVIFNPASGTTTLEPKHLERALRAGGFDHARITVLKEGQDVFQTAANLVQNGCTLIIAAGGDGTINAVASALIGTRVVLGILPTGTLNHLARDLRIPQAIEDAVHIIAHGDPTAIDVGEVNGRYFLNNSSIGLYPKIVDDREHQRVHFGRPKWTALLFAALRAVRNLPFLNAEVKFNNGSSDGDDSIKRRTPCLFVGNNEYELEGAWLGSRSRLDTGTLSLVVAHPKGRWGLIRLALRALFGRLRGARDLDVVHSPFAEVNTRRRRVRVAIDGETIDLKVPLHYRCHSGALMVMLPKMAQVSNSG